MATQPPTPPPPTRGPEPSPPPPADAIWARWCGTDPQSPDYRYVSGVPTGDLTYADRATLTPEQLTRVQAGTQADGSLLYQVADAPGPAPVPPTDLGAAPVAPPTPATSPATPATYPPTPPPAEPHGPTPAPPAPTAPSPAPSPAPAPTEGR